jgi:hypothetical protein
LTLSEPISQPANRLGTFPKPGIRKPDFCQSPRRSEKAETVQTKTWDKLAERLLLAMLLMPALLIAGAVLKFFWDGMALERFYRDRPILQAMRLARDDPPSVESAAAAAALLQHVPVGTDATTAIARLSGEGFDCVAQPPSSGGHRQCSTRASGPFGWTSWTVELQFDASARLTGAKVTQWNMSL